MRGRNPWPFYVHFLHNHLVQYNRNASEKVPWHMNRQSSMVIRGTATFSFFLGFFFWLSTFLTGKTGFDWFKLEFEDCFQPDWTVFFFSYFDLELNRLWPVVTGQGQIKRKKRKKKLQ